MVKEVSIMDSNRFTNNAQKVLRYAQQSADRLGHDYVGTEHLLLALVLNKEGVAGQVLGQLGLTPNNIIRAIETHVQTVSYTHLTLPTIA